MRARLRQDARAGFPEAFVWYERQRAGLGLEFEREFEKVLRAISESPKRFAPFDDEIRKGRLKRFPYFIYFAELSKRLEVIAIIHCKRNPAWILKRLRE